MVASIVESVWMLSAVLGALGSAVMLYITHLQVRALRGAVNGRRRQLHKNVRNEVGRASLFGFNAAIGVYALATPNDPHNAISLIAFLFIFANVVQMVNVVMDAQMGLSDLRHGMRRDTSRDEARDARRDPVRDEARDEAHDLKHEQESH